MTMKLTLHAEHTDNGRKLLAVHLFFALLFKYAAIPLVLIDSFCFALLPAYPSMEESMDAWELSTLKCSPSPVKQMTLLQSYWWCAWL